MWVCVCVCVCVYVFVCVYVYACVPTNNCTEEKISIFHRLPAMCSKGQHTWSESLNLNYNSSMTVTEITITTRHFDASQTTTVQNTATRESNKNSDFTVPTYTVASSTATEKIQKTTDSSIEQNLNSTVKRIQVSLTQ